MTDSNNPFEIIDRAQARIDEMTRKEIETINDVWQKWRENDAKLSAMCWEVLAS